MRMKCAESGRAWETATGQSSQRMSFPARSTLLVPQLQLANAPPRFSTDHPIPPYWTAQVLSP